MGKTASDGSALEATTRYSWRDEKNWPCSVDATDCGIWQYSLVAEGCDATRVIIGFATCGDWIELVGMDCEDGTFPWRREPTEVSRTIPAAL